MSTRSLACILFALVAKPYHVIQTGANSISRVKVQSVQRESGTKIGGKIGWTASQQHQ
jgi:hypothetical protein